MAHFKTHTFDICFMFQKKSASNKNEEFDVTSLEGPFIDFFAASVTPRDFFVTSPEYVTSLDDDVMQSLEEESDVRKQNTTNSGVGSDFNFENVETMSLSDNSSKTGTNTVKLILP